MKVKEVIALAAANLGREDLAARAGELSGEPAGELLSLLRCYNLIENEVALDYFPLKKRESFTVEEGTLPYSDFTFAPVTVLEAREHGVPVSFELYPAELRLPRPCGVRTVEILYSYSPAEKGWEEESEFSGKISARLLSFGVASEFCLTNGQFSEAAMWEKKFRDALRSAHIVRRPLLVRSRRWA